jgi:hypothetical protein
MIGIAPCSSTTLGHGYSEAILHPTKLVDTLLGIDAPKIDYAAQSFDATRLKAISMPEIHSALQDRPAKRILTLFEATFASTSFTSR